MMGTVKDLLLCFYLVLKKANFSPMIPAVLQYIARLVRWNLCAEHLSHEPFIFGAINQ